MSDNAQDFVLINKPLLEQCLKDLGSILKKKMKGHPISCELIIVGGASIVLNYGFRISTGDIDCTDEQKILMNDVVNKIADKYSLPEDWINTSFMNSASFSNKIYQYSSFYRTFGNGILNVRTIKDEYLLAMKVVSGRKYKNDYSDILGIILECNKNGKEITIDLLESAIIKLYDSFDKADKEALEFAKKVILNPNEFTYEEIREKENSIFDLAKAHVNDKNEKTEITDFLARLNIIENKEK